jgi:hypothetical protein
LYQLPFWVWPTALMSVCAVAYWRGREDERLAATALLANWGLSVLLVKVDDGGFWDSLAIDLGLVGIYVWLALRSARYWPLFAAAFQILIVVTHLGRVADPSVSTWAYMTAGIVWSYLVLFAIGYGAWTAPRYAESDGVPTDVPGATRR